ncbi:hypothetical protein [Streptomyces uncialis]|uniref:hypothetical protein n=1 Tax=Streptomyces uncialis TaxID=1048205 RepID=UPI0033FFB4AB
MGWTHDHSDTARDRRSAPGRGAIRRSGAQDVSGGGATAEAIGIPRILRRRARWVSARLRHTRS